MKIITVPAWRPCTAHAALYNVSNFTLLFRVQHYAVFQQQTCFIKFYFCTFLVLRKQQSAVQLSHLASSLFFQTTVGHVWSYCFTAWHLVAAALSIALVATEAAWKRYIGVGRVEQWTTPNLPCFVRSSSDRRWSWSAAWSGVDR